MLKRKELILDLMSHDDYRPMKIKELSVLLQLSKEDRQDLERVLDTLVKERTIVLTKRGKYMLNENRNRLVGRFISHQKGFGFVEVEGLEEDIFIPGKFVNTAFHHDIVAVELLKDQRGKRQEGMIVEILERGKNNLVGTYEPSSGFGFVVTDDKRIQKDIYIPKQSSMSAMKGHKVVVHIRDWGDIDKNPSGEVVEIIGHKDDPETAILSIVKSLEIPTQFPDEVKAFVATIPENVNSDQYGGRLDLRDVLTVTIDGADAKDLDDAITLRTLEKGGYELGVHIADVAQYVTENSPIDKEAVLRSTSVYLVDRVIPMLPRQLSNGICSLNAGVDRLALSCIMRIDQHGEVVDYEIRETIIKVDERMTYSDVSAIVEDHNADLMIRYAQCVDMFEDMLKLAHILRSKRKKRGSIDFDFPEAKVKMDADGTPTEIYVYERNEATRIIEEFMLLANEVVAEHFYWQEIPFVYRNHEEPDMERIQSLGRFIYNFGYHIKGKEEIHPKEIQKLLIDIEGKPEETLISRLALRSMKQARYEVDCRGHYGLAAKFYSHFTSPIRRYPDLQIHRIIKEQIRGELSEKRIKAYKGKLPDIAKLSSENERRAEQAERETIKLKKVEFMVRHIGDIFDGVISGVTSWGLYVELPNTIEGLVHVSALDDDYYVYNEHTYSYVGERFKKVYTLGDMIQVQCTACNIDERTIDFRIVPEEVLREE